MSKEKLPSQIVICGVPVNVVDMDEVKYKQLDCLGAFDPVSNTIYMLKTLSIIQKYQILIHEIAEYILSTMNAIVDAPQIQERTITLKHNTNSDTFACFTDILFDTLQRNNLLNIGGKK